jgi:hypothetical protein
MNKIIKYFDLEKKVSEFIVMCVFSMHCCYDAGYILGSGLFSENKTTFFIDLFILLGFIGITIGERSLNKRGKSKMLEKNKGWSKFYAILMTTVFLLGGISLIAKIASGEEINILIEIMTIVEFITAILLIVGTIINRVHKEPKLNTEAVVEDNKND